MQPDDKDENQARIARAFVGARRAGTALPAYPGDIPTALGEAYGIQDAAIGLTTRSIAGWKVGKIEPPVEEVNRLSGPIFADQVVSAGDADDRAMPVFGDGFAAAEAEFLLRIGTAPDLAQRHFTIDEARALIDAVHVGIEIASSPYPGINSGGPTVTISDFGNNNGLVIGADIPDWREADLSGWPIELWIDGRLAGAATAATMLDGPFGAARFLFEHMAERGIALSPGQWISSGAVTGVHPVKPGERVEARFDGRYAVRCRITAR